MLKFQKTVSRGSRFNQIYLPKSMEGLIEPGDEVEVRLVRKRVRLHYSTGLKKLSEFKENLINSVFSFLAETTNVDCAVVGSFLTEKVGYNDIDLVILASGKDDKFENSVYDALVEKFNLKFHIIAIDEGRFGHLLKICPLTRAMFGRFVCNRPLNVPAERLIDKRHIKFLLMMPYDLLDLRLSSRSFFDSLRRLVTIERFLENKSLGIDEINGQLQELLNPPLYKRMRNNDELEENSIALLRGIMKARLAVIEKMIERAD